MKPSAIATNTELKFVVDLAKIDGKIYYFNNYGQLQTGWMSLNDGNRYYFNANNGGAAYTGWYQDGNTGIIYFNSDGAMQKGITQIEGKTYLFTTNCSGKIHIKRLDCIQQVMEIDIILILLKMKQLLQEQL